MGRRVEICDVVLQGEAGDEMRRTDARQPWRACSNKGEPQTIANSVSHSPATCVFTTVIQERLCNGCRISALVNLRLNLLD